MNDRFAPSGVVIAIIGFILTRFTVTFAAINTRTAFVIIVILPLVSGLGLSAFGVILTVDFHHRSFVRTVTRWCLAGTFLMLAIAVVTLIGTDPWMLRNVTAFREHPMLSNILIGGALGGTLTGVYAARVQDQKSKLKEQTNRTVLLNRLLRDRIINTATVIDGRANLIKSRPDGGITRSADIIESKADAIVQTIEDIKYLAQTADRSVESLGRVDIDTAVAQAIADVRSQYPQTALSIEYDPPGTQIGVYANEHLTEAVVQLLQNSVKHNDNSTPTIEIGINSTDRTASIWIRDDGPGLPPTQQQLLEHGDVADFDDPTTGFGLNIVRLLTELFEGQLRTVVTDQGSTVEIELLRIEEAAATDRAHPLRFSDLSATKIGAASIAAIAAGICMGAIMQQLAGLIPVIGSLYGVGNPLVGTITHLFHSVVFAVMYLGLLSGLFPVSGERIQVRIGVALGFSVLLWLIAAGVVMPLWLRFAGIESTFPNLTVVSLIGHLVWGMTLAIVFHGTERISERAIPG